MGHRQPTRADDEEILTMLDLRDGDGLGMGTIGKRMGKSKGAVSGVFHRVRTEEIKDCKCRKAANKDGGMGRGWWKR